MQYHQDPQLYLKILWAGSEEPVRASFKVMLRNRFVVRSVTLRKDVSRIVCLVFEVVCRPLLES